MLLLQIGMATAKSASQDFTPRWFSVKQLLKGRCLNLLKLLISCNRKWKSLARTEHTITKLHLSDDLWQIYVHALVHSADQNR